MKRFTKGNFFCLAEPYQGCSPDGPKMMMDGTGIEYCEDGSQSNLPNNYMYTTTDGVAPGVPNAATPAIGIHALNFATLDPKVRPLDSPHFLSVGYDDGVTAHMQQVWAVFTEG